MSIKRCYIVKQDAKGFFVAYYESWMEHPSPINQGHYETEERAKTEVDELNRGIGLTSEQAKEYITKNRERQERSIATGR